MTKIDFDRPSLPGKYLGDLLVLLAREGRKAHPFMPFPEPCLTCAFRPGTFPNLSPGTGIEALNCVVNVDPADFCCHHGLSEGEPTRVCAGYVAAKLAPFDKTKELLAALWDSMARLNLEEQATPYVDSIRTDFDAWYMATDPEGKLDAYQLARAYAMR